MTTYKEGDLVTIKIANANAGSLNTFGRSVFFSSEIIKHEPAPEPADEVEEWLKNYTFTISQKWSPLELKAFSDAIISKVKRELGK